MKEKIHIAVCLDNGFVMPTGVLMYSACVNNQDVDIDFHVLIDESVNEEEQKDLKDTISRFHGKRAIFYALKSMTALSFPLVKKHLTRAAYYRLFLSDILPSAIEKVLYLDGDIIVRHSLLPLWNTDVSNYAAGTVMDVCDGDIKIYNRLRYPYQKGYFNSGVLLINLKYWRDHHIVKEFVEYINHYPERIKQEDQDVMNVVLQDKKLKLPVKYNLQTAFLTNDPCWDYWKYELEMKMAIEDPVMVHFTSKWKPWFADLQFPHPYRNTFWKYQSQTKWKNISYDRRSLYMKIRNGLRDYLREKGLKKQIDSIFLNIPPID